MFDKAATTFIAPVVGRLAQALHRRGVSANALTWGGLALGVAAALCIARHAYLWGLALILASRAADALDGAVARLSQPTDQGGFLDITLDMLFYALIPLAFAVAAPKANALPAAVLLACFVGTGGSFLAYAVIEAKREAAAARSAWPLNPGPLANLPAPPPTTATETATPLAEGKSFVYVGGLTEAGETLAFFVVMCCLPRWFGPLAYLFAALCVVTIAQRIHAGMGKFSPAGSTYPGYRD